MQARNITKCKHHTVPPLQTAVVQAKKAAKLAMADDNPPPPVTEAKAVPPSTGGASVADLLSGTRYSDIDTTF